MKVVRICQEYLPSISGPTKQASAIASGLAARGHQNVIMTSSDGAVGQAEDWENQAHGISIHRYPIRFRVMRYYILDGIRRDLSSVDADVFHVHGWRNQASDLAIQIANKRGIPTVLHAHGSAFAENLAPSWRGRWVYKAYDLMFKTRVPLRADAVVVSTTQERRECVAYGIPEDRVHIIPSGIDPLDNGPFRAARNQTGGPPRALFVGRLSRDRNVELAIRAMGRVRDARRSLELRIVGGEEKRTRASRGGYLSELKQLVADLGLSEEVSFAGVRRGPALLREYAEADMFVYTSRYENFGNTVLEAAAAGLPLLVTRTGVANDILSHGGAGHFVSMDDPDDLARRLCELADNAERRVAMGSQASQIAFRDYDWENIVTSYEELYQSLTSRTGLASV